MNLLKSSVTFRIFLVFLVGAMSALPQSVFAYCQMRTGGGEGLDCKADGEPMAWTRRCTSQALDVLGSSDLTPAEVREVVQKSVEAWTSVSCEGEPIQLEVHAIEETCSCNQAEFNVEGGNVNSLSFVSAADWQERYSHDNVTLAITTVWHNVETGEILDADMEINEGNGPYAICPAQAGCVNGDVDLQNVVTHEMGHYFGLAHPSASQQGEELSTMSSVSNTGETLKRTLEEDDINGICAIYPPGLLPETCDDEPYGGLDLTGSGNGADGGTATNNNDGCSCDVPGALTSSRFSFWMYALTLMGAWIFLRRPRTATHSTISSTTSKS